MKICQRVHKLSRGLDSVLLSFLLVSVFFFKDIAADGGDWTSECAQCSCSYADGNKFADCSGRDYTAVPGEMTPELQSINLGHNHIVTLQNNAFSERRLINLKKIVMTHSLMRQIEPEAFYNLNVLSTLDLSNNDLDKIDPDVFAPLRNLKELKLNGNKLYTFSRDMFPPLPELRILELSACSFTTLPAGIFDSLSALETLDLSDNKFSVLSVEVFSRVFKLQDLKLVRNSWTCDCRLRALHKWTLEHKLAGKTKCMIWPLRSLPSNPVWESMNSDEFMCLPVTRAFRVYQDGVSEEATEVSAQPGSDITIECHIEADPEPVITWYKDDLEITASNSDVNKKYFVAVDANRTNIVSKLTIRNLEAKNSGRFKCRGGNRGGIIDKIVKVTVPADTAAVLIGGTSKTWLWILLGLLALILLIAAIIILTFCCIRRRRHRRKTQRVGDVKAETLADKIPLEDRTDYSGATSPLIEKSEAKIQMVGDLSSSKQLENGFSPIRAGTPVPQGPDFLIAPQHGISRIPPFLSGSQVLVAQEMVYHPGGYATYNPRQPSLYSPLYARQHPQFGRLHSPFSGSVASFTSEPPARVLPGPAYVTLPRRRRVPSWSPAGYATGHVPPSPTPSLPVPNLRPRFGPSGPRYDTVGPRTTADGGSNASLNKIGLSQAPVRTPAGLLTPGTPSTPDGSVFSRGPTTPSSGRITPTGRLNYKPMPVMNHFSFDPIEENDGPATPTVNDTPWSFPQDGKPYMRGSEHRPDSKIPPLPPAKPKRKSLVLDEPAPTPISNIQGTEV